MSTSTSTHTRRAATSPATEAKAPDTAGRRNRGTRFVAAGAALAAAAALALGAAALARDDDPATVPAQAEVAERGSPRAIEGPVEEAVIETASSMTAYQGSPRAIDGPVEETVDQQPSGLAAPAHPSMVEHGTPTAAPAPAQAPATGGLAAPAHPSMVEHDSSTTTGAP